MASKPFMDETKKVFKYSNSNPGKFWKLLDAVEDVDNVYHFCMKLFESLTSTSKDQYLDDDHQAMYSTLMVLQFYKNTKVKPQRWLEETERMLEESKPKLFEHTRWIVKLYLKNFQESQFALNFIASCCHVPEKFSWQVEPGQQIQQALRQASDYEDMIQMKRKDKPYKKFIHIAYGQRLRESKIGSFSYCCFLDYLRSCSYQPKKHIWLHIIDILKGLIHGLRFTHKSYDLVKTFLFLISNIVTFSGCSYEDIMKEMIYYANIMRNGYGHVTFLADSLFDILHHQLKCPGTAFRKEIKRRFASIDAKRAQNIGSKKYYLTNRKVHLQCPEYCSLTNLRKLTIHNILCSCQIVQMKKYWQIVQTLDGETTYQLYFKIMRILEISGNLETYESIQKLIREGVDELFKLGWKPYRKVYKEQQEELQQKIVQENTMGFFQFPSFEIYPLKPEQLSTPNHRFSLPQLFEQIKQYPYNQFYFSSFLQFLFLGNDQDFSQILQTFAEYFEDIAPNEQQKVAFYILPVQDGHCSIAEYLSYKDLWYKRNVFNVFKERLLFPYVSLQDPQMKDSFPFYLYNKNVHIYLRQAQRKVPIQIFMCDISTQDPTGKKQTIRKYFVCSVLIGISSEGAHARQEIKKDKRIVHVDGLDYYLDKAKKLNPLSVDINAKYQEPGTEVMVTRLEKNMVVEDIQICNTPKPYFFGSRPNPTSPLIQTSIMTYSGGKIFRNELQVRQNFKRHSEPEILQAFKDLFINMTVESIIIQRSQGMKQMMKIMIDGIEVSNVHKFKVTAAMSSKNLPMTLPIRCFLPFQA